MPDTASTVAPATLADVIDSLVDSLVALASSNWFPLLVFTIAALDALVPVVPSETLMIAGGAAAAAGGQSLALVLVAGAVGAFVGDNSSYQLGTVISNRVVLRRPDGRTARRLAWASRELGRRSALLIIAARFIPGGRTAVTLASGATGLPRRRFIAMDAVAVSLWATYSAGLGYLFGRAFQDDHTTAFLAAFGAAVTLTLVVEVVRWRRERRHKRAAPAHEPRPTPRA